MSYTYNDATMAIAAQIAYLDFDDPSIGNGGNQNIGDLVDLYLTKYGDYKDGVWELNPNKIKSKRDEELFKIANSIIEMSTSEGGSEDWRNWNVVDVSNDQNNTGYYGILIETGDGNAIISNRGSEKTDFSTGWKDWAEADFGMLDNELTAQQKKSQAYMEKIWSKYGEKYDSFSVTGHSLGGNLAQHMTITAPAAMRDKLDHCISFDGPGFSDEYIKAHQKDIEKVSNKIDHYKWSIVSSLLNVLPGVNPKVIQAQESFFKRHSMYNIEFNENGEVQESDRTLEALIAGPISVIIESLPSENTTLVMLPTAVETLIGLKMVVKAITKFREIGQKVKSLMQNIYYNHIAPQVSGTYEVNKISVSNLSDEIYTAEGRLQTISDEIDDLRRNLKYWSSTGAYYKSLLVGVRTGLEIDLKKLKKMAEIADYAVSYYNNVDSQVKNSFV